MKLESNRNLTADINRRKEELAQAKPSAPLKKGDKEGEGK